jgi:hypothetical protein
VRSFGGHEKNEDGDNDGSAGTTEPQDSHEDDARNENDDE